MKTWRPVLAVVLLALLLTLARQVGFYQGIERGRLGAGSMAVANPPTGDPASPTDHEATVARLAGERDMAQATADTLRDRLESTGVLVASERAELELYRRIGSDEIASGLSIDTLERRRQDAEVIDQTLLVTLVQARGRDRVTGRMEVRAIDEAGAPAAAEGSLLGEASFDLRFFETLELTLSGVGRSPPFALDVLVIPDGSRHEPFRQRHVLEDIRQID